ncbi:MAG: acetyl-CoA C-acetyltransferase [Acidobacteria bacterium]|nr:acetyl-CoA C-acetyltransferase [Acidobacteriota bacterium]
MREAVIVGAVRTPTGKFLGTLKDVSATELGAIAIAALLERTAVDPAVIDECIMGNVVGAGLGQAPARQAALHGGLPHAVAALTINKVCGSGLKAVMLAAQGIAAGDIDAAIAGGMESMSNCPYLLQGARDGLRMGHRQLVDSMILDGLWDPFHDIHMGMTGEHVAEIHQVTREAQDRYAVESHRRAALATASGWFRDEIVPVEVRTKSAPVVLDRDESVRGDTSVEALGRLKPAFKRDGTVTAGNAPGVNDAAAALLVTSADMARTHGLEPMARIVGSATSGLEPKLVMMTPVEAVRKLLRRIGWTIDDVELVELNEAFSVQAVAVTRELGLDPERVNVHGGAVALGHPIGASGARILTTLLYALRRTGRTRGIATLCLGGGNGVALAVEAL